MADNNLSFSEKTYGRWTEIFNEFISDDRFHQALAKKGKHVPSPFNLDSKKDGFRLDPDFENKNGRGYDNASGSMNGVDIIAQLTGDTTEQVSHKIHQFIDGQEVQRSQQTPEQVATRQAEIERSKVEQAEAEQGKLEFAQKQVASILTQDKNNDHLSGYLESRGLGAAIENINPAIFAVDSLYYDKKTSTPGIVAPVVNNAGEVQFLHRTYLNDQNEKNPDLEANKKVTPKIKADAYDHSYGVKVNNASNKDSKTIHVAEGIESALAVSIITNNQDPVISTINTGGMVKFMPGDTSKNVVIWADNDEAGVKAANALKKNLDRAGINANINLPKTKGHDFLDSYLADEVKNKTQTSKKIILDAASTTPTPLKNDETKIEKTPAVKEQTIKKLIAANAKKITSPVVPVTPQKPQPKLNNSLKAAPLTITDKAFLLSANLSITPQFVVNQLANKVSNESVLNEALSKSVSKNNLKTLKTLIKNPAININTADENGTSLLMGAVDQGNSKIVNALLTQDKLNINALDNNGNSALMSAVHNKSNTAQLLIKQQANLDIVNNQGDSALSLAVDQNNIKAVKTLVQQGVKITNTIVDRNPLILAATKSAEMLQLFNAQSLAEQDKQGDTSLNIAIKGQIGSKAIRNLAQVMNAHDVNIQDNDGKTPLINAVRLFDKNTIQAIIKQSNVNLQDKNGDSALHHAVNNVDNKTIELLIKNKANVNLQDKNGDSALHHAVTQSNKSAAHLIKAGADINAQDFTGDSALTIAARDGNLRSVVALMRSGAKVGLTNNDGLTAAQVAKPLSLSKGLLKLYERHNNQHQQNANTQAPKQKGTALQQLQAKRLKAEKTQGLEH